MKSLLRDIRSCTICESHLPLGPRPIVSGSKNSKVIIIGQAPGKAVHESGIPWDDKSGDNLRKWMGIDKAMFYDEDQIAILPMGFCYPGKGASGDLPPRPECAPKWHGAFLKNMSNVKLTLLIGKYAQDYYLDENRSTSLTDRVRNFEAYLPNFFTLPHPSPRNNIWQAKHPWFSSEVLPVLKQRITEALD